MDQQLKLFFRCQSCLDYVLTTNIQCPNGHQVCQGCFENLSHCPTCHQRVAPSTRIPFLLTTNVDPILNVGDAFDLILPSLLRIAPALHPCVPDEMIYVGKRPSDSNLDPIGQDTGTMQQNNCLADQLLMANTCEVEETLTRLGQMFASMSSPTNTSSTTTTSSIASSSETAPPPGLVASSTPLPNSSPTLGLLNNIEQQQVDNYTNF